MKHISVDRTAQLIGVSSATIRNWVKSGLIRPHSTSPLLFLEENVISLKNKLSSGTFEKLKKRANKIGSRASFIPEEYSDSPELVEHIERIVSLVKEKNLPTEPVIFLAALHILSQAGEFKKSRHADPFELASCSSWKRKIVKSEISDWRRSLKPGRSVASYQKLSVMISQVQSDDFLGLLYQSLLMEGGKSEQGSYYTPAQLIDDSLDSIKGEVKTFLDPCCGAGRYLMRAARKFSLKPDQLVGVDSDRIAVQIARINLFLAFAEGDFSPRIFCKDTLAEFATGEMFCDTNAYLGTIDFVATNPPWGAYKNAKRRKQYYESVRSGETFSLFLERAIKLLRPGGRLSFLLPESILKIRVHADVRELILRQTRISRISLLGRPFTGVFTPVVRIDLVKGTAPADWLISIDNQGSRSEILQQRFSKNEYFTFDISTESRDEALLAKIYSVKHATLQGNAEWALGIVTGDNQKYIFDTRRKNTEAVFRGADIHPYHLGEPQSFLVFSPAKFQQVAPEKLFRTSEKLIYKFISKKLVFAYDDGKNLTLNSANILIPKIPELGIKVVLAFLNSSVFQHIFRKRFSTHKVLRGDLEKLPFPTLDKKTQRTIERHVDTAIATGRAPAALEELIFAIFGLNQDEIAEVKKTALE